MNGALKDNWLEALVGLVVIAAAALFIQFAAGRTSGAVGDGRYTILARFPNITGVAEGTDVRVSGMKVGAVTGVKLDPKTYQAEVRLSVDDSVRLPADSSAAITSEGLLGGSFIALLPGGDPATLKPGDEITDTQGATDLMGLVGSYINRPSGGDAEARTADAAPAAAAATSPADTARAP